MQSDLLPLIEHPTMMEFDSDKKRKISKSLISKYQSIFESSIMKSRNPPETCTVYSDRNEEDGNPKKKVVKVDKVSEQILDRPATAIVSEPVKPRTAKQQKSVSFGELNAMLFGKKHVSVSPPIADPIVSIQPIVPLLSKESVGDASDEIRNRSVSPASMLADSITALDFRSDNGIRHLTSGNIDVIPIAISKTAMAGNLYHNHQCRKWQFGSIIKGPDTVYSNVVGEAQLDGVDVIYKFCKGPSRNIRRESEVCRMMEEYLKSVKHFSRSIMVTNMNLKCNRKNMCKPEFPNARTKDCYRSCDVFIQKIVKGDSLIGVITIVPSFRRLFSAVFQILKVLEIAQKWLGYR